MINNKPIDYSPFKLSAEIPKNALLNNNYLSCDLKKRILSGDWNIQQSFLLGYYAMND